MFQIPTAKWFVALACLFIVAAGLAAQAQGQQDYDDEPQQPVAAPRNQRVRRQQAGGQRVQVPQPGVGASLAPPPPPQTQPSVNLQTGAMALTSSLDAQPPSVSVGASGAQARPPKASSLSGVPQQQAPQPSGVDQNQSPGGVARPMRKRRPRVRPTKPVYDETEDDNAEADEHPAERRRAGRRRVEHEDEYCDDDYDDDDDGHHGGFSHLFRPMHQMTRMMGSVMNQMQGMASNGFPVGDFPAGGGNMAMAQSMSNSDGYSRLSSLVNNNGRTRGIVSETRNGRTQTRRIGDGDGVDENENDDGDQE